MRKVLLRTICFLSVAAVLLSAISTAANPVTVGLPTGYLPATAVKDATFRKPVSHTGKIAAVNKADLKKVTGPQAPFLPVCGFNTVSFTSPGLQNFTVPAGVTKLTITAVGAAGGNYSEDGGATIANAGGAGASVKGSFAVSAGDNIRLLVGGKGADNTDFNFAPITVAGGGGGGSFVAKDNFSGSYPMLAAGGGGGAGSPAIGDQNLKHANIPNVFGALVNYANNGVQSDNPVDLWPASGDGGVAGSAGSGGDAAGGGAGWLLNGDNDVASSMVLLGSQVNTGGKAPRFGGFAGDYAFGGQGGVGGGGSSASGGGGGGGFSGGGGGGVKGDFIAELNGGGGTAAGLNGGGGGSYNGGLPGTQVNTPLVGTGDGYVIIEYTYVAPIVTGGKTTFCAGEQFTYTNSCAAPGITYTWSSSNAAVATVSNTGVVSAVAAGTATITLTDSYGTSSSVTITVNAVPVVTAIAGTTSVTVGGTSSLSSTPGGGLWSSNNTAVATVNASTGLVSGISAGTATISYKVTNASGCSTTVTTPVTVTSTSAPLTAGSVAGPQTICSGSVPAAFTSVTAAAGGTGGITYQWQSSTDNSNFTNISGATSATYAPGTLTQTTYYRRGAYTANDPVVYTASLMVTIAAAPTVSVSGTNSICAGQSTTLTAAGGNTYSWNTGASTAAITVSPLSTTTYTVTVTNAAGCQSTASRTVTVNPLPTASVAGTNSICAGQSTTLVAAGGGTYLWNTGATTAAVTVSPSSTTTYTVTVTSADGCQSTASRTVTVNPLPTASVTGTNNICEGQSTTLTAAGGATYLWSTGATTAAITVSPSSTTTYTVTATSTAGCQSTASRTVTVNALPTISGISGNTDICARRSTSLTASSSASSPVFNWYNSSDNLIYTGSTLSTGDLFATTTYYVEVVSNGCISTKTPVTVNVKPMPPQPVISQTENCDGTTTLAITNADPGATVWFVNTANPSVIITANSVVATGPATYKSIQNGANGCQSYDVTITVAANTKTTPAAPTGMNVSVCAPSGANIGAYGANGETILWYTAATGGNSIASGNNYNTNTAGTYYAEAVNAAGCVSATRTAVIASINPQPPALTYTVVDNCNGTATITINNATGSVLWNTNATTPSIVVSSTGVYSARQTVNGCISNQNSVMVSTLGSAPPAPTVSGATAICPGKNAQLTATSTVSGVNFRWYDASNTLVSNGSNFSTSTAGTYYVEAVNNGCVSPRTPVTVTFNTPPPTPVVTTIENCNGTTTLLQVAPVANVVWRNVLTPTNIITGNPITVTGPATYETAQQDANGCISQIIQVVVNANTKSIPTISGISGNTDICARRSTSLTASSSASSPVFNWYNSSDNLIYTGSTLSTGDLFATITYYVEVVSNGCASAKTPVTVNVKPMPLQPVISQTENCDGTTTLTITNQDPGATVWFVNTANPSVIITANSVIATGPAVYKSIQNGANGCQSYDVTINVAANTKTIQTPTITADGPTTFCAGGSVTLTASEGNSYLWSNGETTRMIAVSIPGSYTVTVTNGSGCSAVSAPIAVSTTAPVTPVFTQVAAICSGASLNALPTISNNGVTGTWSPALNNTETTTYTFTPDAGQCATTATMTITVNTGTPFVVVDRNTGSSFFTLMCPGKTFDFGASVAGLTYEWTGPNGFTSVTQNNSIANVSILNQGEYWVTATNSNGCTFTRPMTMLLYTLPAPTITASGPTTFCPGGSVTLTASDASSYLWSNGATTKSITVSASGTYTVAAPDLASCIRTSAETVVTTLDNVAPVTPVLPVITAACSVTVPVPTTTDDCAGIISGTTNDPLTYQTQGTYTIHWTFSDGNGNSTTANQTVIIRDLTLPVISCPDNITASASNSGNGYGAIVTYAATATDNCGTPTITYSPASGSFFATGTTQVTATADDGNGNTTSCTFLVTVIAPEINVLGNGLNIVKGDAIPQAANNTHFGSTFPGLPITKTYTIQNTGDDNLIISSIGISGADATSFALAGPTGYTVAPGSSVTFDVIFTANTPGTKNAKITVGNNDFDESAYDFAISAEISCTYPVITGAADIIAQTAAGLCSAVVTNNIMINGIPAPLATYSLSGATSGSGNGTGSGVTFNKGITTVVVTVTNTCGSNTASYTVTVEDNENPLIVNTPANITKSTDAGLCGAVVNWAAPVATDNCPGVVLTSSHQPGSVFPTGTTTVTYTATDASGHAVATSFTITVNDDEHPIITIPGDITHSADAGLCSFTFAEGNNTNTQAPNGNGPNKNGSGTAVVLGTATATDNCGVALITGIRSDAQPLSAPFPVGITTIQWTVTDTHGNTAGGVQTVTITDDEFPVINGMPASRNLPNDAGTCGAVVNWTLPVAADNCPGVTLVSDHQSGELFPIGTTTVHYTATDAHGHITTSSFDVVVADTEKPTVQCPSDITVNGNAGLNGAVVTYNIISADNCGTPVVATSVASGSTFPIGTTPVTITVTDAAGNVITCSFTVTVRNNPPVAQPDIISTPEDTPVSGNVLSNDSDIDGNAVTVTGYTVNAGSYTAGSTAVLPEGTLVINANGSFTFTPAPDYHGSVPVITYTITDINGATASATLTIQVTPVNDQPLGVDDAATVNEDGLLNGSVRGNDTESGDGGNTWSVVTTTTHGVLTLNADGTYTYAPAPNFHGTDVFTYQVCDADGDCSSATVTITVNSVDDAGMTLTRDITVYLDVTGNVSITPEQVDNGSYDPDGIVSITINQARFTCANLGANNTTMTVTDANGNVSTAVAIVTVIDNIPPVITCPAPVTVACASAVPAPDTRSVLVSDNCSAVVTWTGDVISNQQGLNKYTITRTYQATDPSGNSATCTQVITVLDDIAPVLTGTIPGSAGLQCIADVPVAPDAAAIASQFTDNCSGSLSAILLNTATTGNNANGWTVTYTYTVSDPSGNTTTAKVIYTGRDTEAPVPVVTQLPTVTGECSATVTAPVAMDNCGGTILGTTNSPLQYTAQGTYFIEWTYNDGNGNVSRQSQTVIVKDVTAPVVTCPANITVSSTTVLNGQGGAYVTYSATASDNCGTPVVSYSIAPGSFFPTGSTLVTVTAVDAKGNSSSCSFTVTVGCVNPVISIRSVPTNNTFTGGIPTNLFLGYGAQSTTLQVTAPAGSTYAWTGNGVTMLSSTTSANPVFTPTAGGSYTFVVTVTNSAGCKTSGSITICVTDIRVPGSNLSSDDDDDHGEGDDHDDDEDDDRQRMCNHSAHSSTSCSHKGHNHSCDHKSHSKYNCAHKGTNDRDDEDQKDCDHKSHSYKDCSHKGHNHASCDHKAHNVSDCEHERNHGTHQKVCDHQSHNASDCSHEGHNHAACSHTSHSSSACSHGDDDDDNEHDGNASGNYKVFLCHVPPGNPGKTITLSISINAVAAHLTLHPGDRLGSCDQQPCSGYTDNVKPVISCPGDVVVSCGASTLPAATGKATATDNSGVVTVTYSDVTSGNVIIRTWKATDGSGNTSTSTQTISIVDNVRPVITDPADVTVNCGASVLPSATGTATATDNCSATIITYTDATNGNIITRTWKATDAAGNYITAVQIITVGTPFTTSVVSVPTTSTYTGGVATNLYLGYGAQSTKLQVGSLPSAGAPYTYVWTGNDLSRLSSSSSAAPVFTPASFGYYSFTVTVTNKYGCRSIASINICVTDIRVPGSGGSKVYMTHTTSGKYGKTQTIEVPLNQVSSHLSGSSCGSNGQDRLGSADQSPCNTTIQNSIVGNTATTTKESGIETATTEEELKVTVLPNPSTTYFTLKLESKYQTPVSLRVMDGNGRVVDARSKLGSNSTVQIGHNYSSGTYYAEMIQGTQRKVVQLIKGRG